MNINFRNLKGTNTTVSAKDSAAETIQTNFNEHYACPIKCTRWKVNYFHDKDHK